MNLLPTHTPTLPHPQSSTQLPNTQHQSPDSHRSTKTQESATLTKCSLIKNSKTTWTIAKNISTKPEEEWRAMSEASKAESKLWIWETLNITTRKKSYQTLVATTSIKMLVIWWLPMSRWPQVRREKEDVSKYSLQNSMKTSWDCLNSSACFRRANSKKKWCLPSVRIDSSITSLINQL